MNVVFFNSTVVNNYVVYWLIAKSDMRTILVRVT
jgi:hypothetical protein